MNQTQVFKYRYVPYGTDFRSVSGKRTCAQNHDDEGHLLYENEVVADVGGVCLGFQGENRRILDHHFFRENGQFPSAAAAVLHNATELTRFEMGQYDTIWLVSHQQPDFDAFASLFLIRSLLDHSLSSADCQKFGLKSSGWYPDERDIDWHHPDVRNCPKDLRWAILIASEAARNDNCMRGKCARHRTLNAVLSAALHRGRPYLNEQSGACEFFEEVRKRLSDVNVPQLDPYFDSILERSEAFLPELKILDREPSAYDRDIRRARRMMVYLPSISVPFKDWYSQVEQLPLVDNHFNLNRDQIHLSEEKRVTSDGIFLRDPESLLFKDWARNDVENSSTGTGFLFTAIAYSNGRAAGKWNQSDYYFSLDPERAKGKHLYAVWAQLQAEEMRQLSKIEQDDNQKPRKGFEGRNGNFTLGHLFADPWYDGGNFQCTIVPTPNRGSVIQPAGILGDLSDDPVARIVENELTTAILPFEASLTEESLFGLSNQSSSSTTHPSILSLPVSSPGKVRFVHTHLGSQLDVLSGGMSEQIGRILWRSLDKENSNGVPSDFRERHLIRTAGLVAVWNRRGCSIAYQDSADEQVRSLQEMFQEICEVNRCTHQLLFDLQSQKVNLAVLSRTSAQLLCRAAMFRQRLAVPEQIVLRRFFEASRLDESLEMLSTLTTSAADLLETEQANQEAHQQTDIAESLRSNVRTLVSLQQNLEFVEIGIAGVYAAELTHVLGESFFPENHLFLGFSVLLLSTLSAGATAWLLQPWNNHSHGDKSLSIVLRAKIAFLAVLFGFAAFLGLGFSMHKMSSSERVLHDNVQTPDTDH